MQKVSAMKKFKALFDVLKERGFFQVVEKKHVLLASDILENIATNCHPFVFHATEHGTKEVPEGPVKEFDAPFPIFSIEFAGEYHISVDEEPYNDHHISALLIMELRPKEYAIFVHMCGDKIDMVMAGGHKIAAFANMVADLLARLNTGSLGKVEIEGRLTLPKPGNPKKRLNFIKDHVFIVGARNNRPDVYGTRPIDWSHRWEVRGHWRRIEGVGKDRAGRYLVPGYTWVGAHVKGPEDTPLVRKTRIVGKNDSTPDGN
jgi:hypothetical protein